MSEEKMDWEAMFAEVRKQMQEYEAEARTAFDRARRELRSPAGLSGVRNVEEAA